MLEDSQMGMCYVNQENCLTEWADCRLREGEEVNVEVDASAIFCRNSGDATLDRLGSLKEHLESDHVRVALDDRSSNSSRRLSCDNANKSSNDAESCEKLHLDESRCRNLFGSRMESCTACVEILQKVEEIA